MRTRWMMILLVACSGTCGDEDKEARQAPVIAEANGPALFDEDGALLPGMSRTSFDVPVAEGDHLEVIVTSSAFDPVLEVTPPGGGTLTNDDWQGSRTESRISVVIAEAGVMKVTVTRVGDATGAFHATIRRVAGSAQDVATAPILSAGQTRDGELSADDGALPDGRFHEFALIQGADQGQLELRIEARGSTIPLAIVMDPQGHGLQASASGVYTISHPGAHHVQLIAPTAGEPAQYRMSLQAAAQPSVPTLSRSHHQLPTTTAGPALALGATLSESLAGNDGSLPTGESADVFLFQGTAGQAVRFELRSESFDTYLMVVAPSGQHWENDDTGGTTNSALDVTLPAAGSYRVVATAYQAGMSGAYELKATEASQVVAPTVATTAPSTGAGSVTRSGELAQGDRTLQSGEFTDTYNFTWPAGATVDVSLTSSAFDTYLIVRPPSGDQQDNDDAAEGNTNSRLQVQTSVAGAYQVIVTSFRPGETGAYELQVTPSGGGAPTPTTPPVAAAGNVTEGALAAGDSTLPSGAFVDNHELTFTQGQQVHLELTSSAFDTYLIVRGPGGQEHTNDDAPSGGTNSALDFVATAAGAYQVQVTSYRPGEQGAYQLVQSDTPSAATTTVANTNAGDSPPQPATGDSLQGELQAGDTTLQSGEFADAYSRSFEEGQPVQIRLSSSAFDPYLIVRTPSGRQLDNDDLTPSTRNAGVDLPAAEAGDYRVTVTSYRPGESGAYELSFGRGQAIPRPNSGGEGGRVFGLFAGITDYPDGVGDLPECANDAIKLAEALREGGLLDESRQVLLTDAQATTQNIRNGLARLAGEMGPDDIFVFFYSGHGGQTQNSTDAREIDGTDEYLVMHDGPLLDNELGELFDPIRARLSVVAVDACFSGGFAKDLITRPGRVGFFSSEEDVLSAVAGQFQAGGYLSHFIRLAVSGQADMSPADRVLTVGELSHFLYTQFGRHATDVQLQGAYQHLVVDRGAVRSDQVLWSYR
ncbi:MAG: pre-peptidase C-terminal domain-containing protein [Myxococcota bacterium]